MTAERYHTQTSKSSLSFSLKRRQSSPNDRGQTTVHIVGSSEMYRNLSLSILFGFYCLSSAHMELSWPPALRSKYNSYTTDVDYDMTSPLSRLGSDYPCKGYQSLLDSPEGKPVATWQPGKMYNFTLAGFAKHGGGSCQASLSFDRGKTWTVIHSYIGQCPLKPSWEFILPNDTPQGDALFAWTWFNTIGNREMYMNCAHVAIESALSAQPNQSTNFHERPAIFAANVNKGCVSTEGSDLLFPLPGPDVSFSSQNTAPPVGECGR